MNCKESFRTSGQEQRGDRKVVVFSSMQRQQKGGWNEKKWEDTAEDTLSLSELCDGLDSVFRPWKKKCFPLILNPVHFGVPDDIFEH